MNKTETTDHADLIGDGIHDDTTGIQALLDAMTSAVYLPPAPKHYLISRTLIIHSGQTLRLDPFTVIRLAPHSDTVMITNDDHDNGNENIALVGGIWDMDNRQQAPNPFPIMGQAALTTAYAPARFIGVLMRFNRVRNLVLDDICQVAEGAPARGGLIHNCGTLSTLRMTGEHGENLAELIEGMTGTNSA